MKIRSTAVGAAAAAAALAATLVPHPDATASAHPAARWSATWASAMQSPVPGSDTTDPKGPNWSDGFSNQTVRQVIRVSGGGSQVRVRLSNLYGTKPIFTFDLRLSSRLGLTFSCVPGVSGPEPGSGLAAWLARLFGAPGGVLRAVFWVIWAGRRWPRDGWRQGYGGAAVARLARVLRRRRRVFGGRPAAARRALPCLAGVPGGQDALVADGEQAGQPEHERCQAHEPGPAAGDVVGGGVLGGGEGSLGAGAPGVGLPVLRWRGSRAFARSWRRSGAAP